MHVSLGNVMILVLSAWYILICFQERVVQPQEKVPGAGGE